MGQASGQPRALLRGAAHSAAEQAADIIARLVSRSSVTRHKLQFSPDDPLELAARARMEVERAGTGNAPALTALLE
jgi:hypothetical protein